MFVSAQSDALLDYIRRLEAVKRAKEAEESPAAQDGAEDSGGDPKVAEDEVGHVAEEIDAPKGTEEHVVLAMNG